MNEYRNKINKKNVSKSTKGTYSNNAEKKTIKSTRGTFTNNIDNKVDGLPETKASVCKYSGKCGACQYIDLPYEEQLKKKTKYVNKLLSKYGKVDEIIGMKNCFNYRYKVQAVVHRTQKGEVYSGTYKEGTHIVVPINKCKIENERADEIINTVVELVKSFKLKVYNENSGFGLIRHILVRQGLHTGEIMVVIVTADPIFPSRNNFIKVLRNKHPEITTIVQNINDKLTTMVLGARNITLYGKGYINDVCGDCTFRISPNSFYQVNPVQMEILYKKVLEIANLKKTQVLLDAYCGTGTIGIIASKQVEKVIGVELNENAIKDAISNAKLNSINNTFFYCSDAGTFMLDMLEERKRPDVVIMDPPRSGSSEDFMKALLITKPQDIVYVSCNPETLARDLEYLTKDKKYKVKRICPVDMFPHTMHVETVVLLERKDR